MDAFDCLAGKGDFVKNPAAPGLPGADPLKERGVVRRPFPGRVQQPLDLMLPAYPSSLSCPVLGVVILLGA